MTLPPTFYHHYSTHSAPSKSGRSLCPILYKKPILIQFWTDFNRQYLNVPFRLRALRYYSIDLGVRTYSLHCGFVWPSPAKKKINLRQIILLAASQRFYIHNVIVHHQMQFLSGNSLTKMAPYVTSFLVL